MQYYFYEPPRLPEEVQREIEIKVKRGELTVDENGNVTSLRGKDENKEEKEEDGEDAEAVEDGKEAKLDSSEDAKKEIAESEKAAELAENEEETEKPRKVRVDDMVCASTYSPHILNCNGLGSQYPH